jgi:hypothetical protein
MNSLEKLMPCLKICAPELPGKLLLVLPRTKLAIALKAGLFVHLAVISKSSNISKYEKKTHFLGRASRSHMCIDIYVVESVPINRISGNMVYSKPASL